MCILLTFFSFVSIFIFSLKLSDIKFIIKSSILSVTLPFHAADHFVFICVCVMCSFVFICWNFFTLSTSVCLLWEMNPTTSSTKRMWYVFSISSVMIVAQLTLESVGTSLSYSGLILLNLIINFVFPFLTLSLNSRLITDCLHLFSSWLHAFVSFS